MPKINNNDKFYKLKAAQRLREYLDVREDNDRSYIALGREAPSRANFARHLGVGRRVINDWDSEHEDFRELLQLLDTIQEDEVLNRALKGEFSAPIAKLVLMQYGYHERIQNDHISTDGTMSPKDVNPELVAELVKKLTD